MTISQVLAFSLIHRPYLYFYPPILPTICMSSSHQLFIHHNTARIAYFLPTFFFLSAVLLRVPTLDSGFVDIVLLVLSIPISVAHVTVTQRARSFTSFHAYSCPSAIRTFTPSCQRHPRAVQWSFAIVHHFSTIHRLLPASVLWYPF